MAEPDDRELYPLATPGGLSIPFDVFRPFGLILVNVVDTVSDEIVIPAGAEIFSLYCTIDCVVCFDADAAIPASGSFLASAFYMPNDTHLVVDVNASETFTVIAVNGSEAGTLYVNAAKTWKDLQIQTRLNRT